jgi:NAD(P)H-flavin reductase
MKKILKYGEYSRITFSGGLSQPMTPGQCVKINGNWYAIAEQQDSSFDVFVKKDSSLLLSDEHAVEGPLGPGFKNIDCQDAVLVAGGTGIGAMLHLLRYRADKGLSSYVVHYVRSSFNVKEMVPASLCKEHVVWNTTWAGRPSTPVSPLSYLPEGTHIFVAGPKSLVEACKSLQFTCNTNF